MIRVGFNHEEKQRIINEYMDGQEINKVFCFYSKKFKYEYDVPCEIEYIEYSDIEMYKYFYRLLEEIDNKSLIIIDECMRTQNRSELIYNCAHHYLNQCECKIIFEYLPIIDSVEDFMILLDFENKTKYKGKSFVERFLKEEDIVIKPHHYYLDISNIGHNETEAEFYEMKKETLFNELGNKKPETVPNNLQLIAGDFKKKVIEGGCYYVARNRRFKKSNVATYDTVEEGVYYIILDFHYRRLNMNDFLKKTKITDVTYVSTDLSIDKVLIQYFNEWIEKLEGLYAKASLFE